MNRSFYNGVSGIKTHQFGMDVWSHNIANINNVGYRSVTPEFSNIFSQSVNMTASSPVSTQAGLGATGQTTARSQKQGSLVDGERPFDMALKGEGWFGVAEKNGSVSFTRNGEFGLDGAGNLTAKDGSFVLGKMGGNIDKGQATVLDSVSLAGAKTQTKITLPSKLILPASPTTYVKYKANLNASIKEDPVDLNLRQANYTQTLDTTNNTISFDGNVDNVEGLLNPKKDDKVYVILKDSTGKTKQIGAYLDENLKWKIDKVDISPLDASSALEVEAKIRSTQEIANKDTFSTHIIAPNGDKNVLKLEFTKRIPHSADTSTWDAVATVVDKDDKVLSTQKGVIVFDGQGALSSSTLNTIDNGGSPLKINLGTPRSQGVGTSGFDGLTAIMSGEYGVGDVGKDGYQAGNLTRYALDGNGQIQAHFDNGRNTPVAKVAIFHFQNDQGLTSEGGEYFKESPNSGKPIFYKNGESTTIAPNKLEMSNVKLSTVLTEVIVMQKAFTASSKSITTSDQLLQNAINMKR